MDLEKIYYDTEGNKVNILQLVKKDPEWAANRIQEAEKDLEVLQRKLGRLLRSGCNCYERVL